MICDERQPADHLNSDAVSMVRIDLFLCELHRPECRQCYLPRCRCHSPRRRHHGLHARRVRHLHWSPRQQLGPETEMAAGRAGPGSPRRRHACPRPRTNPPTGRPCPTQPDVDT